MKTTHTADPKATLALQTQELRRNLQTPISAVRVALERKISLRFPHFQGFLTEYSSNISITGMFVRSQAPRPPGTLLDFEFTLIDGLKLIRGTGEVVWTRHQDEGPQQPAGMGIKFLRLDKESRRLIRWAVEKQIYEGVEPFDLQAEASVLAADPPTADPATEPDAPVREAPTDARPASADPSPVESRRLHPYAGYAVARGPRWRRRLSAAASGAMSAILVLWALYVTHSGGESPAFADAKATPLATEHSEPATELTEPSKSIEETTPTAAPLGPAVTDEPPLADASEMSAVVLAAAEGIDPLEELLEATADWAEAWASQRPDEYLASYSKKFQPPRSMSRSDWEALRIRRISRPHFIQVGLSRIDAELLGPEHARVRFDQAYRSDNYRDFAQKTLELVREDGEWKILAERAG
ncbi:MAG: TIGR02266 family protein [Acidobacteriota bacterium]